MTDQVPRSGYPTEVVGVAVTTVDWNDIRRLVSLGNRSVLIDLDLRDVAKVKTIKDNLPNRGHDQCRLVAIDRSSHFAEVQAYGLGATDLLKRPFDIHELSVVLHRQFGQGAVREQPMPDSAGTLIVAWTQPGPRQEMSRGREPAHVAADLRQDDPR